MRTVLLSALLSAAVLGCADKLEETGTPSTSDPTPDTPDDGDGDGYGASEDCDDTDEDVHPGAWELCDGLDNNCDGQIDEDATLTFYPDADGDGYGDIKSSIEACEAPSGTVSNGGDCADDNPDNHPGADEVCDTQDNDCDGQVDEDDAIDATAWYADTDNDGYGSDSSLTWACTAPGGHEAEGGDCDDTDPRFHPGASESDCADPLDYNCDGEVAYADEDGDGWAACLECDDLDALQNPGADEVCNGEDDNCDGETDESSALDADEWFLDADGDGYGNLTRGVSACSQPSEHVADSTDCDDTDAAQHPGADELCSGEDDDCDGTIDEDDAVDAGTWYSDGDGDGYGDVTTATVSCEEPSGYLVDGTDCDDTDPDIHPAASEVCDEVDQDCDGDIDEDATDMEVFYLDDDGDGYGNPDSSTESCTQPSGYLVDSSDCDDTDATVYPGAEEDCEDGVINDCDLTEEEAAAACPEEEPETDAGALAEAWLTGESDSDESGGAISAGDFDGDGELDVMVGAWGDDDGGSNAGAAYVVLGPLSGELSLSDADLKLTGESSGDYAGSALAGAGDADGDGLEDLLVGAWREDDGGSSAGATYLILGGSTGALSLSSASLKLTGESSGDYSGAAVAGAGDADGDGLADLLVGAWGEDDAGSSAGAAYLILGGVTGTLSLSSASLKLTGESSGDYAGSAVAGAGDVDGDGLSDLLVGAWGEDTAGSSAGVAYLVLGGVTGTASLSDAEAILWGETAADSAGDGVASAGDTDSDGFDDILVSATGEDTGGSGAGAVYLLRGPISADASLADAAAILYGESGGDQAGSALSLLEDVDGDGGTELAIGAWYFDGDASGIGAAYVVSGSVSGAVSLADALARIEGTASGDYLGGAVSSLSDVDGDGMGDLLVGAYGEDTAGSAAGATYLILSPSY